MSTPNSPVRPIPPRPNLERDRKEAKSLLDAVKRGDPTALGQFKSFHPRFAKLAGGEDFALHDAQLVIARQYGFASWPRWKQFVETRRLDRARHGGVDQSGLLERRPQGPRDAGSRGGSREI